MWLALWCWMEKLQKPCCCFQQGDLWSHPPRPAGGSTADPTGVMLENLRRTRHGWAATASIAISSAVVADPPCRRAWKTKARIVSSTADPTNKQNLRAQHPRVQLDVYHPRLKDKVSPGAIRAPHQASNATSRLTHNQKCAEKRMDLRARTARQRKGNLPPRGTFLRRPRQTRNTATTISSCKTIQDAVQCLTVWLRPQVPGPSGP